MVLVTEAEGTRFSARNQIEGVIAAVNKGAVNSEALLNLAGDEQLTAVVTNTSADTLGLKVGLKATALFKAGSVILAVPA